MAAFLITTGVVIVALVLIYAAVKRWYRDDYEEGVTDMPSLEDLAEGEYPE